MSIIPHRLSPIIAYAKEYGFIYPSSEIYNGLQAVYDYGPYGVALKRNVQQLWWQTMTQLYGHCMVGIDTAILMHPTTWQASGHVDSFADLMVDNKDSKKRYRVDTLIENHAEELLSAGKQQAATDLLAQLQAYLATDNLAGLHDLLMQQKIACPVSKTCHWTEVRQFNLMFSTKVGAQAEEATTLYLRPETAQGIFVNFHQVLKTTRQKLPFGIAQIGKAFRNEIVARQFIFRMREFEQMEMQFFIKPGSDESWFNYWQEARYAWHLALGIPAEKLRLKPHDKLAHYAKAALDIEYDFPFGFKEIEGIHARGDFDLKNHENFSKKKLTYFDPQTNTHLLPHVVETSVGCDRLVLMLLCEGLREETLPSPSPEIPKTRTYLQLHPALAPIKAAIFPLIKDPALQKVAWQLYRSLSHQLPVFYEEQASIGKRYARQDLIGTPYCLTVDHQTLEDETITLRERDSMQQTRISLHEIAEVLVRNTNFNTILEKLYAHAEKIVVPS